VTDTTNHYRGRRISVAPMMALTDSRTGVSCPKRMRVDGCGKLVRSTSKSWYCTSYYRAKDNNNMAKTSKPSEQNGKVKFRIIEFEMEGSDETLHDSLKNIAAAFARAGAAPTAKAIRQEGQRQLESNGTAAPASDDGLVDVDVGEDEDSVGAATQPPKRATSPRKSKIAPVKVIGDIRLDDVSPTLKEFCLEKMPSGDLSRYLVIAYWFKNCKDLPDLTPGHFYTAYRLMSWNTPRDPAQPIRDLRHNRRGKFSPGQAPGTSTINHIGENSVNEMGSN
jgi:hypothetical protein